MSSSACNAMRSVDSIRWVLGTRSPDKLREVREILAPRTRIEILSLTDLGIPPSAEEESLEAHETFQENARAKATYFARLTGLPTLADDSGLAVDALDGAPGVHSKRFSARTDLHGAELDRANNQLLLDRLVNVPAERRTAHYVCAAVLAWPHDHRTLTALGTCAGIIAPHPLGEGGFGYDPLFLLPDLGVTFGQVSPETKHRRSHRARAFRALAAAFDHNNASRG